MAELKKEMQAQKKNSKNVQFTVVREFIGAQTMQEVFEQLIERQVCAYFEKWMGRKAG